MEKKERNTRRKRGDKREKAKGRSGGNTHYWSGLKQCHNKVTFFILISFLF